jgi:large subunit ribosomal protein L6
MSRIGRAPIPVPAGVQVQIDDHHVRVKGPLGQLEREVHPDMSVELRGAEIVVERPDDSVQHRALHGLTRTLVANMVTGVTKGFEKTLELSGVGYRVAGNPRRLSLQLGFSHPIEILPPEGIEISQIQSFTPTQTNEWLSGRFTIRGIDKEVVGEIAAKIRKIREIEPYKGKGLRYQGERIRRKAGKAAGKGKK